MLKLNSQQLKFLASVQLSDDWHATAFMDIVTDYKQQSNLQETEFQNTIAELQKLSLDEIASFQMALNILNSLGWNENESIE
ncbi:MAG: hypothetical protein V7L26_11475 [Nostoc sp.]